MDVIRLTDFELRLKNTRSEESFNSAVADRVLENSHGIRARRAAAVPDIRIFLPGLYSLLLKYLSHAALPIALHAEIGPHRRAAFPVRMPHVFYLPIFVLSFLIVSFISSSFFWYDASDFFRSSMFFFRISATFSSISFLSPLTLTFSSAAAGT